MVLFCRGAPDIIQKLILSNHDGRIVFQGPFPVIFQITTAIISISLYRKKLTNVL